MKVVVSRLRGPMTEPCNRCGRRDGKPGGYKARSDYGGETWKVVVCHRCASRQLPGAMLMRHLIALSWPMPDPDDLELNCLAWLAEAEDRG